jgi:cytidylate kinase
MNKEIITIAGMLGSGKSRTAKMLKDLLNYQHYSTGDLMRKLADEKGVTLAELGRMAEIDPSIDETLDNYNRDLGTQSKIILDSRLGFHFIPHSYKVFLDIDPDVAAERILKDRTSNPNRINESDQQFDTVESIAQANGIRLESERKRYQEMYKIADHTDHLNFDLVINTGLGSFNGNVDLVVQTIFTNYQKWLDS